MLEDRAKHGFTLIETMIASAILTLAIIGITVPMMAGLKSEKQDAATTLANSLAQELMDEILIHSFNDQVANGNVGPEANEASSRSLYDSINDYHGLYEPSGQIKSFTGEIITDPAAIGLSRNATVSYVYVSGQDKQLPPSFATVIVEVKYHGQSVVKLTRLVYDSSQ